MHIINYYEIQCQALWDQSPNDLTLFVGETFTGRKGKYVSLKDTVQLFIEIIEGKHDSKGEQAFYMIGGVEDLK